MDSQTAETLLYSITAVGAVVWVIGLHFLVRSFSSEAKKEEAEWAQASEERPPANWICGSADVEGQPPTLIPRAIAALVKGYARGIGSAKILERGDDRIVFEGVTDFLRRRQSPFRIRIAQIRFTSLENNRTRIDYAVQETGARWLLWVGAGFQCAGLIALVAGFLLVRVFLVANPSAAARTQTIQMMQCVHFLWPPFLFAGIYRIGRRAVRNGLDLLVHNLPYYDLDQR